MAKLLALASRMSRSSAVEWRAAQAASASRGWRVTLRTTRARSGSRPARMAAAKLSGWTSRPTARPLAPSAGGGLWDCVGGECVIEVLVVMNRRRSRASVNRSQAGIRSRRRPPGVAVPPQASALPLHESSSEAQSAKTGSDPTAAHGLSGSPTRQPPRFPSATSAVRLLKEWLVFQHFQKLTMQRPRPLSITHTPTYHQRTAPARHTGCSHRLRPQPPFRSRCAAPPQSLSLGSFAVI
jgi:hypothetical protein